MMLFLNGLLFLVSFVMMEFVAWLTHKHVMHGMLWRLHRDHHTHENDGFLERNDFFFLLFAIPGILFFFFGAQKGGMDPRVWIGAGITLYGLTYVIMHDIFIHQRVKLFTRTDNAYLRALRKAHKVHHTHLGKEDGECFGMLWVPWRYLAEARGSHSGT